MRNLPFCVVFFVALPVLLFALSSNPEAEGLFKKAEAAYGAKDLAKALGLLTETLNKEANNAVFRFLCGRVMFEKGDFLGARENFDIVRHSYPLREKGLDYCEKLKDCKMEIKKMQASFDQEGEKILSIYQKNQTSWDKFKLAVTLFQAFRLSPQLILKNIRHFEKAVEIYEKALESSFKAIKSPSEGWEWRKEPMLQLAFLYKMGGKQDEARDIYMRSLDYVTDLNEEFISTFLFDSMNPHREIEGYDMFRERVMGIVDNSGSDSALISREDRNRFIEWMDTAYYLIKDATPEEEREIEDKIEAYVAEKWKRRELPGTE